MFRRLHFDLWYLFRPPWDSGKSPPELLAYLVAHRPGRAIDLGCGSGTNVLTLLKHGWHVTGVDFSPRAIRLARRKIQSAGANAELVIADLTQHVHLHGTYDLALDIGCFHGVQDRSAYIDTLSGLLDVGAHWLMYAFLATIGSRVGAGLASADFEDLAARGFQLLERREGVDRHSRPSAWLLYEKVGRSH